MARRAALRRWIVVPGLLLGAARASVAQEAVHASVGSPGRVEELVLPAPELEARPAERSAPLVLRVLATRAHGSAFRYDLEFTGLEPGEHDLRDYLRPVNGEPLERASLPPIPVRVDSLLAPGQVLPNRPERRRLDAFGGYRLLLLAGAIVWLGGLWAILRSGRRRELARVAAARPPTLAEELRPLVERALRGELEVPERSELELKLLAYWRERSGLDGESPELALAHLRAHPEAGPLFASLERWLHAPGAAGEVDLERLLAPYRDLPCAPEAAEGAPLASA